MARMTEKSKGNGLNSRLYTIAVMLIAMFCAILLWLYVLGYDSPDFEKKFSQIPVSVIGTAELSEATGYTVISDIEFSFDVTVSGKKTDVNSMRDSDITAYVDVSAVTTEGGIYLPVDVIVPNGITVKSQSVSRAYLYIDETVTAEIPVKLEISDYTLPENAVMGDYTMNPTTVTVQGPKAEVEKIGEAYAHVFPGVIAGSVTMNTSVELRGKDGLKLSSSAYLRLIDKSVSVTLPVYVTKELPVKVQFIGGIFGVDSAVVTLSKETVEVRGTASSLAAIDSITFNIDETTLGTNSVIHKKILLPDGVENVSGVEYIEVGIKINQMGRRTVTADQSVFVLQNAPQGVDVQIITQTLNIDFIGPIDLMRYFNSSYFVVIVDLSGIAVEVGDNFFVPATVILRSDQPGVYATGDYSVNIIVN